MWMFLHYPCYRVLCILVTLFSTPFAGLCRVYLEPFLVTSCVPGQHCSTSNWWTISIWTLVAANQHDYPPSFDPPFIIILKSYFKVESQLEVMGSSWSPWTAIKRTPLLVSKWMNWEGKTKLQRFNRLTTLIILVSMFIAIHGGGIR